MFNTRILGRASRAAAIIAAAALAAGSLPASAAETQPAAKSADSQSASKPAGEKKYCVVETVVGSRLPLKTCKTRDEWIKQDGFDPIRHQ